MTKQPRGSSRSGPSVAQQLQQIAQLGQTGNLTKAATQCQKFLQRYPDQAEAWHLLSLICLQQGQAELALAHIQRAIDLDPNGAEFHSHAGVVQCSLGNLAAGIACYQRALSLQPSSHTRFNLGLAFQKLGQLEAAEQTYRMLVADQPNYSAAYQQLGNIQQQRQQFLSAIHSYQQALQHQPQVAATWCNLAVAFQTIGDSEAYFTMIRRSLSW
ncbi:tetratricopeptide repeat protein [Leptolyngbya sp. 7M]|uniref:tetratricopeptide repeat protein n=1 Tax=Leptolyngbya sp. 7M TaxID=2812896 RepID=UPI001B8B1676|nr:tetratricopeptide repeat protein [Leptolyngbya sp. 7M]QYO64435.1 tetratricopeptide repeat protein [Leptolyngbya sp. 7M]